MQQIRYKKYFKYYNLVIYTLFNIFAKTEMIFHQQNLLRKTCDFQLKFKKMLSLSFCLRCFENTKKC
jgi:hypothetical protein